MCAARGLDGDGGQAMWALFGCRLGRRRFLFPLHPIDGADEQEYHKGDDEEADDGIDEHAVVDGHRACRLRVGQQCVGPSRGACLEQDEEVGEIHIAQQQADGRHDDIVNQRLDDSTEGSADDDAHGHVNHVATHDEFFELFPHV